MGKNGNGGKPTPKTNGLINIAAEDGTLVRSGNALFDFGKVLDGNLANDNGVEKLVNTTLVARYQGSGTPTPPVVNDRTTSLVLCTILPTLGGVTGQYRAQLAFKDQFVKVVGDSYYSSSVTEADLIKLFMYNEGLAGLLMVMALGLKLSKHQSKVNATISERALRLYGFDYTEVTTKREQYINAYNRLAKLLNDKFYLAENAAVREFMYLISHVFVDSKSQKAQMIMYRPVLYTDIDFTDGTVYPETALWQDEQLVTNEPNIDLTDIVTIIERAERFASSAWYNQVAPNLYHIYGDDKRSLVQFADYSDSETIFTFNYAVIDAMRNGKIVNQLVDINADIISKATIYEDNNGFIRQGGSNLSGYLGLTCMSVAWSVDSSNNVHDVYKYDSTAITNVDEWPADNETKENALAFYFIERSATKNDGSVLSPVHNYIDYCGHVLLLRKTLVRFTVAINGQWSYTPLADADYVGSSLAANLSASQRYSNYWFIYSATMFSTNVSSNKRLLELSQTGGILASDYHVVVHDKDNMYEVNDSTLKDYYVQLTYDVMNFNTPSFRDRK